jgi:hypothetical protein
MLMPKCAACKHFLGFQSSAEKLTYEERLKTLDEKTGYCEIFPEGEWIPKEVWAVKIDYTNPNPDSRCDKFEKDKALSPGAADEGGEKRRETHEG